MKIGSREEYDKITGGTKIFGENDCPFCELNHKSEQIFWIGKYWKVIYNIYPYSGNKKHIMAVPLSHKQYFVELSYEEFSELKEVHKFVKNFYKDCSYFSFTRESMANRTIEHLHMHFLPGKLQGEYIRKMLENQGFPIKEDLSSNLG